MGRSWTWLLALGALIALVVPACGSGADDIHGRLENAAVDDTVIAHRESVVRTYIEGLNDADVDAVVGLFSNNVVIVDPLGSKPVQGLEAARQFFLNGPFLHPIQAALEGEIRVAGNSAAFAFIAHSDGLEMRIIDVFEFDDEGKVNRMLAYWSQQNVTKQVE